MMRVLSATAHILRHVKGGLLKALLLAVLSAFCVLSVGFVLYNIVRNESEIERLYDSAVVTAKVLPATLGGSPEDGVLIRERALGKALEIDPEALADVYTVRSDDFTIGLTDESGERWTPQAVTVIFGTDRPERYFADIGAEMAEGYDAEAFKTDEWVIMLTPDMMETLGVSYGDNVCLQTSFGIPRAYRVIGTAYITAQNAGGVTPKSVFEKHIEADRAVTGFSQAEFTFKSSKNRDLPSVLAQMEEIITGQLTPKLTFYVRDRDLRSAIKPLEKALDLLRALYPIVLAVTALAVGGVSAVYALLRIKEAATERVLGVNKISVAIMFTVEHILLCGLGVGAGLASSSALFGNAAADAAGLYALACAVGSIAASAAVFAKKPMELLQVAE